MSSINSEVAGRSKSRAASSWNAASYGENCSDYYDDLYGKAWPGTVAQLAEWAGSGRVLELGIGTGRTALALARCGISVMGVEVSAAMLTRLRSKPGGDSIPVILGDFSSVSLSERFSLVFALCSTIHLLPYPLYQNRCFRNVAHHLQEDGIFVIEAGVPAAARRGAGAEGRRTQRHFKARHHLATSVGERAYVIEMWCSTPPELDDMARSSGLHLVARWGNWQLAPFDEASPSHVSVYASRQYCREALTRISRGIGAAPPPS